MGNCASSQPQVFADLLLAIQDGDDGQAYDLVFNQPKLVSAALDDNGSDSFHIAVLTRNHAFLEQLLCWANSPATGGDAPKDLRVKALKALKHARSSDGATPLMLACNIGDDKAVRMLLQGRASPWLRDRKFNRTCLHFAAAKGHTGVITLVANSMLESSETPPTDGMDPRPLIDMGTQGGFSALMHAAWFDKHEAVTELLQLGASLKTRCNEWGKDPFCRDCTGGSSALHVAVTNDSRRAAWSILAAYVTGLAPERDTATAGPDPRLLLDSLSKTPFDVCRALRRFELAVMLNPMTPIGDLFDGVSPTDRQVGVPPLVQIAAMVAQKVLLEMVQAVVKRIQGAKAARLPARPSAGSVKSAKPSETAPVTAAVPASMPSARANTPSRFKSAAAQGDHGATCTASVAASGDPKSPKADFRNPFLYQANMAAGVSFTNSVAGDSPPRTRPSQGSDAGGPPTMLGARSSIKPTASMRSLGTLRRNPSIVTSNASVTRCDSLARLQERLSKQLGSVTRHDSMQLLDTVVSMAGELPDSAVEGTLAAVRFHRLVHGVSEPQSEDDEMQLPGMRSVTITRIDSYACPETSSGSLSSAPGSGNHGAAAEQPLKPRLSQLVVMAGPAPQPAQLGSIGRSTSTRLTFQAAVSRRRLLPHADSSPALAGLAAQHAALQQRVPTPGKGVLAAAVEADAASAGKAPSVAMSEWMSMYGDDVCPVCLDEGDFVAMKPCNHVLCGDCATELVNLHPFQVVPCPICRVAVSGFGMPKRT